MIPTDHKYTLRWPEGAKFIMDEKSINEIKASLESQFKHLITKQPGFKFYHSLGNTNFFQHFRTADGIDFGVCHFYWEHKEWKIRWLPTGNYTPIGKPSPVSDEGWRLIHKAFADKIRMVQEKANIKIKKENEEVKTNEDAEQEVPKLLN